jgi:hypothetical protein
MSGPVPLSVISSEGDPSQTRGRAARRRRRRSNRHPPSAPPVGTVH